MQPHTTPSVSKKVSTTVLTYSAICIALAVVLNQLSLYRLPWGGSVTPMSMFFITLIGYLFGFKIAIMGGVVMGLMNLALGGFVFHPAQVLLDYPLAFGALGVSGFFRQGRYSLHIGFVAGALARWFFHFLSGWLFFYIWAPAGWNYLVYSAVYNIAYIGVEMVLTLVVLSLPVTVTAIERVKRQAVKA